MADFIPYDDDCEMDTDAESLRKTLARVREARGELTRTIRALRLNRRTPEQIRVVLDEARRALYKSRLLRRTCGRLSRIN
jgi:hypothetical protein